MGKRPTQAERFWQAERARKAPRRTPTGTVLDVRTPFPAARLAKPGAECAVDAPIREALDAGLVDGPFDAIREDLAVVCTEAWGAAAAVFAEQLAAPEARDRQAKAARLAADLRAFLAGIEAQADSAGALEDKMEIDAGAADLRAMLAHGGALIPLLEEYAEPETAEQSPPATDHLAREFFGALGAWWNWHAIDPDRRGASAIRNRLALGLWEDMGQSIPAGYSDYDFARRGFRLGKIAR